MEIIFLIITFVATLIGSVFGIGGGIIIKPAIEAFSGLPLTVINALSGITVLCMAAVSLVRYLASGIKPNRQLVWMSAGAVAGGFLGKALFDLLRNAVSESAAKILQYSIIIVLIIVVLFKNRFRSFKLENTVVLTLSGLFMGMLSAFLGIGGGPINLLVIYLVIGIDAKRAAVYSVFVILCSQIAMVGVTAATGGYSGLDLGPLLFMIPAAVAGGLIGPVFHKKWGIDQFEKHFNVLMIVLIALNIYNIIHITIG